MNSIFFSEIVCLAVTSFIIAFTEGNVKVCHLVSFSHGERILWALKSESSSDCTQIAIGGHSSLELLPERLLLFESPYRLLTAGENIGGILEKKRMHAFFNAKSGKRRSLPIEKGSFGCQYSSTDNNVLNPPLHGLIIESSSALLIKPAGIRENAANQSIIFNITLKVADDSSDFDFQQNVWKGVRVYTATTSGLQSGNVNDSAVLITEEPNAYVNLSSDPCGSIECLNGGTCMNLTSFGLPNQCICPFNFRGDTCLYKEFPCHPNPCRNGGSCIVQDSGTGFKCECILSFNGERCEDFYDSCSELQCENNGTCRDIPGQIAFCMCPDDFNGPTCANRAPSSRHPAIKQTAVYSNFDTMGSTCGDIPPLFCVTMEMNPSFSVTFLNNSQTACFPLPCRGVEILDVNLENQSIVVIERISSYNLSVDISVESEASGASISGTTLWKLVAFFDTQESCRGETFPETRTQNSQSMDMPLTAGETLILKNISISNMTLLGLVCPNGPLYLCVQLGKHPSAMPPFTLSFSRGNNIKSSFSTNASMEAICQGVEILQVKLESPGPEIMERDPSYSSNLSISVESDVGGASISGTSLWKLIAFFDTQVDCRGNSFPESLTQNLQVDDMPLVAGEPFTSSHSSTMNLSNLVCPNGNLYLCIKFEKHPNATPPFTLNFSPENTNNYASVEATCRGVVISENNITIIRPAIISTREDKVFSFNVTLGFSQGSGSVVGTSLWEITAFVSHSVNGDSELKSDKALVDLTIAQRRMSAMPGEIAKFDNLQTTLKMANFDCPSGVSYLCFRIKPSPDSMPTFSISGEVKGCAHFQCKGVLIESSSVYLMNPDAILENTANQSITIIMALNVTDTGSASDFPGPFWNTAEIYTADEERNVCESVVTPTRRSAGLKNITELVMTSTFNTVGLACENLPKLFCVTLESDSRLIVTFLRDSQTACAPLPCRGVEVSLSEVLFESPVVVKEGNPCHNFNLDYFVTFGGTSAAVSGNNLWELVIFGSNDAKGLDTHMFHTLIPINNQSLQNQDAVSSAEISFTQQQVTVDLTGINCADVSYVCVEINRDGSSNPTFTLTSVPESAKIACQNLTCIEKNAMQCKTDQQFDDCSCLQSNTSDSVRFGNLSQCYCNTSSREKCTWLPKDCDELYERDVRQDGVYTIHTTRCPQLTFNVYCDMTNNGGGWTVFQRRTYPSSVAFNQNWTEYQDGFGDFENNFWLGNEKLCHLTQQQRYKLSVDFSKYSAIYHNFSLSCSHANYTLLGTGSFSSASDYAVKGLAGYMGKQFNTCDRRDDCECGWWCCPDCDKATNLNRGEDNGKMTWGHIPLHFSQMKLKPFKK